MALKVTSAIKKVLADRDAGILAGIGAVRTLLTSVRTQIVAELADLGVDSYSAHFLRQSLAEIDRHLRSWEGDTVRELDRRLTDSWELGERLLPLAADAAGVTWAAPRLSTHILDSLKDFTFGRIAAVRGDMYNRIRGELTLGVLGQKTPQEVSQELVGQINRLPENRRIPRGQHGRPMFQSVEERAEVITGTEMGRAFSMATQKSIEAAVETVPELRKMWLHAGHPKQPRQIHLLMHGQVRKADKAFYEIDGKKMMYPRDPAAPIKEVIRCGCTHIPYHPDWGTEEDFAKEFDVKQEAANKPKGPYTAR